MKAFTASSSFKELKRLSRFLVVGGVGTLLDFSILTILKIFGLPTLLANSVSFTIGVVNNYTWNRLWTFADVKRVDWHRQFAQFALVSSIGLVINNLLLLSLERMLGALLGQPELGYLPAKAIATGVVVFWNYFANRYWTFMPTASIEGRFILDPKPVKSGVDMPLPGGSNVHSTGVRDHDDHHPSYQ
jgi:putative flippase GtrA